MQIIHMAAPIAAKHPDTGIFINTLFYVTAEKTKDKSISGDTRRTYSIRQNQVLRYIYAHGYGYEGPEAWDEQRIKHFVRYMMGTFGYAGESVRKCQNLVFSVLEECRAAGHITRLPKSVKIPRRVKPPTFCTPEEIDLLKNHAFAAERLAKVRDLFLVQCFSGVSYCDLIRLKKYTLTHIDGIPVLQDTRKKTDVTPHTIPLIPELLEILERYKWELPIISNQKYNTYIKEVAEIVGIKKALRTHDGRRTCAMYYLRLTGNYDATAAVLGHTTGTITRKHYAPWLPMHLIEAIKRSNIFRRAG